MLLPWQPSLLRRPMLEKGVFSLIFLGVPGHQSTRCSLPGLACSREGPAEPAHGRRIPGRGRRSSRSLLFPSRSGQLPLRVTTGRAGRGVPPPQSRGACAPPHRTVGWEWVPPFPTDGQGVAQACGAVRGEGRARRVALPLSPVRCPPPQCALLPESGLHQGAPCSLPEAQRQDGGPAAPRDTAGVGCWRGGPFWAPQSCPPPASARVHPGAAGLAGRSSGSLPGRAGPGRAALKCTRSAPVG